MMFREFSVFVAVAIVFAGWGRLNSASAQQPQDTDRETLIHYSLYAEDFKNKDFERALPNLRWMLANDPIAPRSNDVNFVRAVTIYKEIGLTKESDEEKRTYLDSALVFLDTSAERLRELGVEAEDHEWVMRKGKFLQENVDHLPDLQNQIGVLYEQAYDMKPAEMDPYYVNYIISNYVNEGDKQGAVDYMDKVESTRSEETEIAEVLEKWRNALFTSPGERYDFLVERYYGGDDSQDLVLEIFELADELDERDMIYELSEVVLDMEPTSRTLQLIAKLKIEDGESAKGFELLEQALALGGEDMNAAEIYFNMGVAQQEMGRLSKARSHYRQALQASPEFGQALVAIGDLYVQAVSDCGTFDREDRAVYWLATDYYDRAIRVAPDLASSVRQKKSSYRGVFPDQEMLFFKNWNVGDRYSVDYGCYSWIGETTTVKAP